MSRSKAVAALATSGPLDLAPQDARRLARRILDAWEGESPTGSPNTLRAKRNDLAAFGRHLGLAGDDVELRMAVVENLVFGGFTSAHENVRGWLQWMAVRVGPGRQRGRLSPRTRARRLAHLRGLVRVAQEYGLPWGLHLRGPRLRGVRDVAGPDAWRVYAAIASLAADAPESPIKARDAAILQLLFVLGLRRQSVADLTVADVVEGSLRVYVKGSEEPVVKTLPPSTQAALRIWVRHRGDAPGPLFVGVRRGAGARGLSAGQIYRICHKWEVGSPHGLRHSGASKLAREGHTVFELQAHLGHASPNTAQIYVDRADDTEGKVSAYLAEELDALYDGTNGRPDR